MVWLRREDWRKLDGFQGRSVWPRGGVPLPPIIKDQPSISSREETKCNQYNFPKDCWEAPEKEILSCLQRKKRKRIKQEYAASVKASQEKIRVVKKNQNWITPAKAIKENKMCFYKYQGKGDYREEIRLNKCRGP